MRRGRSGSTGSLLASLTSARQLRCSNARAQRGKQRCSWRAASVLRACTISRSRSRVGASVPARQAQRSARAGRGGCRRDVGGVGGIRHRSSFQWMRTTAAHRGRSCGWVELCARRARGASAGGRERAQAGAHVGDQLVADAHQREPEQVLTVVAAVRVAGAPDEVARAVLSERRGWVNSRPERGALRPASGRSASSSHRPAGS